jgi:iron complex outermembrane recepter protein
MIRTSLATVFAMSIAAPAAAQETRQYDISARDLGAALRAFAEASGREVLAESELVRGKRSQSVRGVLTAEAALRRMIERTDLRVIVVEDAFVIRPLRDIPSASGSGADESAIIITGTRIRGAPLASPVITIDQTAMRDAGQTGLGDVVRSIPQSFGGGQNPGVGANVPSASGVNVGSASTINLRGLGSDATLTLLNGHRLAYNGTRQGVDVSAIPLGLVDRIEIVADGASALYGSDAVAGVANIILKRDYVGLETRADIGGSTHGGNFQQQFGLVGGQRWTSGSIIAAYEFANNSNIVSDDRDYANSRRGVTLYPELTRHAAAINGRQEISNALSFAVDALFNTRRSLSGFPLNAAGDLTVSRVEQPSTSRSLAIAPSLNYQLGDSWQLSLSGVYGEEKVQLRSSTFAGNVQSSTAFVCYCNNGRSAEVAADGNLFALSGGLAKLAVGAGYRDNTLDAFRGEGNLNNVRRSQDSFYAYGELNLPVVSPTQDIAGLARLNLSGAVRYERYPGIGSVVTPKFGVIYAPFSDVILKGGWGKSFRAPTLFQQYQVRSALLYPVSSLGGSGYPPDATALLLQGGNASLKPERATTWTATIEYSPATVAGLKLQLGYFSIRYTDRIVTPIAFQTQALSNALYARQVALAPSQSTIAMTIANAAQFFNVSGRPFNPVTVAAIVDNSAVNAGRQSIQGVDLLADYRIELGTRSRLIVALNVAYLESRQQLVPDAPIIRRAGTLFNPPNWRGRASATWTNDDLTLNATASRIGGVDDTRTAPAIAVDGMTTLDLTARYAFDAVQGPLKGLAVNLTMQNVFDDQPTTIATAAFSDTAYDSTNYSPIGRYLGIGLVKSW